MEETVKEGGEIRLEEESALLPSPNSSLAFLALGGAKKEALKVASAFSCRAFCVEEGEESKASYFLLSLPGGGEVIRLKKPKDAPLSHLLFPLLPEEASLVVFHPGKVEVKADLYSMSCCYITDIV